MTNELAHTNFTNEESPGQDIKIVPTEQLANEKPTPQDIKIDEADKLSIESPYKYKLPDGTWVSAESKLQAIKECPFLSRMPLEQAEVILEFSNPNVDKPIEPITKPETIIQVKETKLKSQESEPIVKAPKKNEVINIVEATTAPEITAIMQEEYLKPEAVTASKELDTVLKVVNETLLHPKAEHQESVIEKVIEEKKVDELVIKEVVDEPAPHISSLNEVTQPTPKVEAIQVEANEPIEIVLHTEEKLPSEETVVPIFQAEAPELVEIEPRSESVIQEVSEEIIIDHESVETESTAEDTFDELVEILGLPETAVIEIDISSLILTSETPDQEPENEKSLDTIFESYIDDQAQEETVPTIELIRAEADDQPIEVSLSKLVALIAESSPQNETLIAEIFELTEMFVVPEDETSTIKFNPEMLSKILSLLELIGYETPEQSLLDLVTRYDLAFLISAMMYLHELSNPSKRHEFSISSFLKPIVGSVINPLAELIGKTVIRFVTA